MPDHRRGFVQKGQRVQAPSPALARAYAGAARHPPFELDPETQRFLIGTLLDVCRRRGWRVHGAATEPTHLHALVSWPGGIGWQDVRGKIRNILSLELSKRANLTGRAWFSRYASRKRVRDRKHFDYLVGQYLPKHGGVKWFEDGGWVEPRPSGRG